MDEGVERIRQLSRLARAGEHGDQREAELEHEAREINRKHLARLEVAIPERLRQFVEAADGALTFEDSAYRSQVATAIHVTWRAGALPGRAVELWLFRETGSVEWRWTMGHREPPIAHRVPASRFTLARLDDLIAALADPDRWRGGHPPDV